MGIIPTVVRRWTAAVVLFFGVGTMIGVGNVTAVAHADPYSWSDQWNVPYYCEPFYPPPPGFWVWNCEFRAWVPPHPPLFPVPHGMMLRWNGWFYVPAGPPPIPAY